MPRQAATWILSPPPLPAPLSPQAQRGAAGDQRLRPYWRGRVGMSKEEQLGHFKSGLKDIEDLWATSTYGTPGALRPQP